MAYTKTNWSNDGAPPLSAANLNKIEQGIYDCDALATTTATTLSNNINYSTSEIAIGTWIDGKTIYRKVIDFGYLANAGAKTVNANLSNVMVINMYGTAYDPAGSAFPINTSRPRSVTYGIGAYYNSTNNTVVIDTGIDRTSYYAYVILEYVKLS